ncbi:MAG: hypothetical protein R3C17_13395 [Planctomycetaceae bacterium]
MTEPVVSEPVVTELVATTGAYRSGIDVSEAVAIDQDRSEVDFATGVWTQLDASTRATILMLVQADLMTHQN